MVQAATVQLRGDDFSSEQIAEWFEQERNASVELSGVEFPFYYRALNDIHVWEKLPAKLGTLLAIGPGNGCELEPVAHRMDRLIAIEPARDWWRDTIGPVAAEYREPDPSGAIDLPDNSADTVCFFGVLHHIPNVSAVMGEAARVLRPGGYMVVREPITTMGDATKPRPGLTVNERGIPLPWLRAKAEELGCDITYEAPCLFPLTSKLASFFRLEGPFNFRPIVYTDALLCRLMAWNIRYDRQTAFQKLAAWDVSMILRKRG